MLPVHKNVLRLDAIAEFWSRELNGIRTANEIEVELFGAFWRDELAVVFEGAVKPIDRAVILRLVNSKREHPGFSLVDSSNQIPPKVTKHDDGSVTVDARRYVILPSDPAQWTVDVLRSAYEVLADVKLSEFDPTAFPVFAGFAATGDVLAEYCDRMGYDRPRFWFRKERNAGWTTRRERQVERWLKELATRPKSKTKAEYFTEASREFPGLPRKAFNRIWERVVPEAWRRSGPVIRSIR